MKFFTQQSVPPGAPSKFSHKVKRYKLDNLLNKLVEDGEEDIFELVQSSRDCALDKTLERFGFPPEDYLTRAMPFAVGAQTEEPGIVEQIDILEQTGKAYERAEHYRDKLGLPASLTVSEIWAKVNELANTLKGQIEKENIKGGDNVEKEIDGKAQS